MTELTSEEKAGLERNHPAEAVARTLRVDDGAIALIELYQALTPRERIELIKFARLLGGHKAVPRPR